MRLMVTMKDEKCGITKKDFRKIGYVLSGYRTLLLPRRSRGPSPLNEGGCSIRNVRSY